MRELHCPREGYRTAGAEQISSFRRITISMSLDATPFGEDMPTRMAYHSQKDARKGKLTVDPILHTVSPTARAPYDACLVDMQDRCFPSTQTGRRGAVNGERVTVTPHSGGGRAVRIGAKTSAIAAVVVGSTVSRS